MNQDAIDKGIAAHSVWKSRLNTAISRGKMDVPAASIRADNQCEFGKWLYAPEIPASDKGSAHYPKIRDLHARFHKAAAKVAELAEAGRAAEAKKEMGLGGEFTQVSSELTLAMSAWRKSLG
jgi:hypothetical protein